MEGGMPKGSPLIVKITNIWDAMALDIFRHAYEISLISIPLWPKSNDELKAKVV